MRRLVAVCAVLWVAGVCGGAVIRVAADGSGDYPTIQAAIDAAVNGDEIILGDGRYIGLGNREMDFLGKALKLRSENGAANCVIDCQAHYTNPRRALTFQSGEDANSVLEGLTFEDGYAFRENGYKGGAIKCTDHSSPRIADCIFFSNAAGFGQGGAIYAEYSSPTIVNCVFIENSADYGGAIFCSPDPVTIRNCVFTGNSAADYGGAIQAGTETLIECCEFTENTCDGPGGAIYGRGQVIRCSFSRNDAGSGGGVYASGWADMTIRQCVFSNNSAGVGGAVGAAAYSQAGRTGHTRLLNSLFTGNSARGVGGAVSTGKDTIATMINCTITENVSGAQGSGIWCDDNPNLTVTNSVVWGNKDISGAVNTAQISNTAAYNVTRCCIGGLKPDEQWAGKFSWDPLFVNADVGDYHLAVDSPCDLRHSADRQLRVMN